MKITIIRHGKVDMMWPRKCTSYDFDNACLKYDIANIEKIESFHMEITSDRIYISPLSRSLETAKNLFGNREFIELSEISEVPLKSFRDTNRPHYLWIWNIIGRIQWFFNCSRQLEGIVSTKKRANKAIDIFETEEKDCILVTHGLFIKILLKELKERGYSIKGRKHFIFQNLEMIIAEK